MQVRAQNISGGNCPKRNDETGGEVDETNPRIHKLRVYRVFRVVFRPKGLVGVARSPWLTPWANLYRPCGAGREFGGTNPMGRRTWGLRREPKEGSQSGRRIGHRCCGGLFRYF